MRGERGEVAVVNCFDPNDVFPELIETLNETEVANWLALSVSFRRARPEAIELIEDYFRFLLNGLTVFINLLKPTQGLNEPIPTAQGARKAELRFPESSRDSKAAFYAIKATLEDKEKWQLFSGNSMLSWQDIVSGRTLLVIQLDFMRAPGESKVLSKFLSHRLSIQQCLQAIELNESFTIFTRLIPTPVGETHASLKSGK